MLSRAMKPSSSALNNALWCSDEAAHVRDAFLSRLKRSLCRPFYCEIIVVLKADSDVGSCQAFVMIVWVGGLILCLIALLVPAELSAAGTRSRSILVLDQSDL